MTIGCDAVYEPDDIDGKEAEAQARKVASETARYLDTPEELATDYPGDQSMLLQQVFEILQANRTANLGELDFMQDHNNELTMYDLIEWWECAARKTAEFHN